MGYIEVSVPGAGYFATLCRRQAPLEPRSQTELRSAHEMPRLDARRKGPIWCAVSSRAAGRACAARARSNRREYTSDASLGSCSHPNRPCSWDAYSDYSSRPFA
jgi:hypothetical protein